MSRRLSCAGLAVLALATLHQPATARAEAALASLSADRQTIVEMSLERLEAMPQTTIVTDNEFTDGEVAYRGPLVREVLAALGLEGADTVRLVAANDYFVDIPTEDFDRYDAILAMEADGRRLSRRDKGPLWLMYPISDHAELRTQDYLRRLIWQVVRIEAL